MFYCFVFFYTVTRVSIRGLYNVTIYIYICTFSTRSHTSVARTRARTGHKKILCSYTPPISYYIVQCYAAKIIYVWCGRDFLKKKKRIKKLFFSPVNCLSCYR